MKRALVLVVLLGIACSTTPAVEDAGIAPPPAAAGALRGIVTDTSGSPLPGVTVTVTTAASSGTRAVITDADGHYTVAGLTPGRYRVRFELAGVTARVQDVDITSAGLSLSTPMSLAVSETVTVTAEAPVVASTQSTTYSASSPSPRRHAPPSAPKPVSVSGGVEGGVVGGVVGGVAGGIVSPAPPPDFVRADPQYARFEDHAFVDAQKQNVTTFAIDVDRASYANIRRFLTAGLVPPPDAVRIEEMVNYFAYNYPQPTGSVPFSITTEVAGCPWNRQNRLLRIGIQGKNLDQWRMAPNNLVFLLDVSGSMQPPQRLPLIKSAFRVLVDQLRAEDRVSIVVYAGAAGLVLPPTSGADKRTILGALDRLAAGGSTDGGAGLALAYKVAADNFIKGGNNRVILATDGDFNVGNYSISGLETFIEEERKKGVFLTTIGVGDDNYQDARMEMLADKGNGNYAYLDSLKEAEKVFKTELTGTLVTIAKDVKVQLEFDPAQVASYRQIGYENRALANKDFADDTKDAGDLGAGHSVTALYEIVPAKTARRGPIAKINLRYKEPDEDVSKLLTETAVDDGKSAYDASPDMQFAAAVAELGMLLRNSPHKGTASFADVAHLARLFQGADADGVRAEFLRIVDSAKAMKGDAVARY
jgi:Ca-activated chloride channel homolog